MGEDYGNSEGPDTPNRNFSPASAQLLLLVRIDFLGTQSTGGRTVPLL